MVSTYSRPQTLFRVDAGPDIGLGHLQRCISLAAALQHFGVISFFLVNREGCAEKWLASSGIAANTLGRLKSWSTDDLAQTLKTADEQKCDIVVVDSDYEGEAYLGRLRQAGFFVCAIEDMAPHPFSCQLVVNGDAHAAQLSYHSSSGDTLFLLGSEYSILRREFWEKRLRTVHKVVENLLVTMGGADPYNLMPRVLRLLSELPGRFAVTAIIGPFFDNIAEVEIAAQRRKRPVKLIHAPHSVSNLMLEADLAISAGGQTLYELACVGCPTVAVQMASNQKGQLQVFSKSGFLRAAGCADDSGIVAKIGNEVRSLLLDSEARSVMSAAGQKLVDGQGALRVAKTILAELNVVQERGFVLR